MNSRRRDHLIPHRTVDKNGRQMTVYRKPEGSTGRAVNRIPVIPNFDIASFTDDDARALTTDLWNTIRRPNSADWDSIDKDIQYILEWEDDWTDAEKRNMVMINQLDDLLDSTPFTAELEQEARDLIAALEPAVLPQQDGRSGSWSTSHPHYKNWCARDKMIHELAKDLLIRRLSDDLTHEPVEGAVENPRLLGLEDAQVKLLAQYNRPDYYKGATVFGDVEPYLQESIAWAVRGDKRAPWADDANRSLLPESERLFSAIADNEEGYADSRQLALALVFPVKELKEEMDRAGIDGVSVSTFENGREWGNVYTVMTPDRGTRSFAVYEHRNTDSIIINGQTNWDGSGLPYAEDSSHGYFGEFPPGDKKRAAQALVFYMMEAQRGTLDDDDELVRKAPRRDWTAILSETIPGFKEWSKKREAEGLIGGLEPGYVEPENETEADVLRRLDF